MTKWQRDLYWSVNKIQTVCSIIRYSTWEQAGIQNVKCVSRIDTFPEKYEAKWAAGKPAGFSIGRYLVTVMWGTRTLLVYDISSLSSMMIRHVILSLSLDSAPVMNKVGGATANTVRSRLRTSDDGPNLKSGASTKSWRFNYGRSTNNPLKVCAQDLSILSIGKCEEQFVKSKCAQIFHQWAWVTLALPRAALPWTAPDKICKKWGRAKNVLKYSAKREQPPANYPTLLRIISEPSVPEAWGL